MATCVADPRALAWTAAIKVRFPCSRYAGTCACRHIIPHDGGSSSTWSEHSWGNAVDFGGSASCQQHILDFASANKAAFGINNIIGPGSSVNVVHVDFLPSHSGTVPACAGGPAVAEPAAVSGRNVTAGRNIASGPDATTAQSGCPKGQFKCSVPSGGPFFGFIPNPLASKDTIDICLPDTPATRAQCTAKSDTSPAWLDTVKQWAEIVGGGVLVLAGLAVAIAGGTGRTNPGITVINAVSRPSRSRGSYTVGSDRAGERGGQGKVIPSGVSPREQRADAAEYEASDSFWTRRASGERSREGLSGSRKVRDIESAREA